MRLTPMRALITRATLSLIEPVHTKQIQNTQKNQNFSTLNSIFLTGVAYEKIETY
jgi:hypothetical protein